MKLKLAHKVVVAIAIPLLFQICFLAVLLKSVEQLDKLEEVEHNTADVLLLGNQISVGEALSFVYCSLFRVSKEKEYRVKLFEIQKTHERAFKSLSRLWKNDKVKQQILVEQWNVSRFYMQAFRLMLGFSTVSSMSDLFMGNTGISTTVSGYNRGNLDRLFDEFERSQTRMLQESQDKESNIKHQLLTALIASLVITLGAGLIFSRSIAMRLRKVVSNIKAMEKPEREQELIVIDGSDEIAALNNAIIDTNKKIKEAELFQAQTAGIVADELEKPLTQINDYFVAMKNSGFDELSDSGHERIERSLLEITRLRALVKDLISLDKISRIGWELKYAPVDLAEIAKTAADTVHDYARQVGVELVLRLNESCVSGDQARLQQIALNLLTNAIKFSPPNSIVEIETRIEHNFGKLSVIDHGTGIPDEFQQKIFGHFEQVSRTDATEKGGSGLGLAISRRLVESQQGRMGFNSELGAGSTFWFSLPVWKHVPFDARDYSKKSSTDQERLPINSSEINKTEVLAENKANASTKVEKEFRSTLWQKSLAMVILPLILQFATIGTLWGVIYSIRNNVNEFNRVSQITSYHAKIMDALGKGIILACLYNIEPSEKTRINNELERGKVRHAIDLLRDISNSDDVLAKDTESLNNMVQEQFELQDEFMNARQDAGVNQFFGPTTRGETERKLGQVVIPLDTAITQEKKLVEENVLAKVEMRKIVGSIALISALCTFLLSVLLGMYMIRGLTARVQKIVENTALLANRKPLLPPAGETDEIGYVERSFFEAANKLAQLEQYKQELIALTSHEFRTPLTSLLAKADLIQVGAFGPLNRQGITLAVKVKRSIIDLITLLTNLLDVEKIQSGKTLVVKEKTTTDLILSKTSANLDELLKERQIELQVDDEETQIDADAGRLVQALTATLADIAQYVPLPAHISIAAIKLTDSVILTVRAPGGDWSQEALNHDSARGRLAVDLLTLIAKQHGGTMRVYTDLSQFMVEVILPA